MKGKKDTERKSKNRKSSKKKQKNRATECKEKKQMDGDEEGEEKRRSI